MVDPYVFQSLSCFLEGWKKEKRNIYLEKKKKSRTRAHTGGWSNAEFDWEEKTGIWKGVLK